MVRGKQEAKTSSVILVAKETWVQFEELVTDNLKTRLSVEIQNNGIENDQSTGTLYVTLGSPGVQETIDPFDPTFDSGAHIINPGGSAYFNITSDIAINMNTDTAGLGVAVTEIESPHHFSKQD